MPLFQHESLHETFLMKISLICMKMNLYVGKRQLGNGPVSSLFITGTIREVASSKVPAFDSLYPVTTLSLQPNDGWGWRWNFSIL